jgi:hypothetical protein
MPTNASTERSATTTETKVEIATMDIATTTISTEDTLAADIQVVEDAIIHIQLRPHWNGKDKALAALKGLAEKHDGVDFQIAGISKDARYLNIVLAINLGPADQIAKHSEIARAAYAFVSALFENLFEYLPMYVAAPTAEQRAAAQALLAYASVAPVAPVAPQSPAVSGNVTAIGTAGSLQDRSERDYAISAVA